jgi:hypothetical protein
MKVQKRDRDMGRRKEAKDGRREGCMLQKISNWV